MSKKVVLEVLERAADDITFYSRLAEDGLIALKDYDLTQEESAALITGDVRWIDSFLFAENISKGDIVKVTVENTDELWDHSIGVRVLVDEDKRGE